jgi:hypothetical protein
VKNKVCCYFFIAFGGLLFFSGYLRVHEVFWSWGILNILLGCAFIVGGKYFLPTEENDKHYDAVCKDSLMYTKINVTYGGVAPDLSDCSEGVDLVLANDALYLFNADGRRILALKINWHQIRKIQLFDIVSQPSNSLSAIDIGLVAGAASKGIGSGVGAAIGLSIGKSIGSGGSSLHAVQINYADQHNNDLYLIFHSKKNNEIKNELLKQMKSHKLNCLFN